MSSPAWIMEPMGKYFWGLVGAVEVGVAPWYGVRHVAHVGVHIQPQHGTCEITERLRAVSTSRSGCVFHQRTWGEVALRRKKPSPLWTQNCLSSKFHMARSETRGSLDTDGAGRGCGIVYSLLFFFLNLSFFIFARLCVLCSQDISVGESLLPSCWAQRKRCPSQCCDTGQPLQQ